MDSRLAPSPRPRIALAILTAVAAALLATTSSCSSGGTSVSARTNFSGNAGSTAGRGGTVVVTANATAAATPSVPAARPFGPLRADGDRILDDQGRTVLLRGANYSERGKYAPFAGWHDPASAPLMARAGVSVVRHILIWEAIEPAEGSYDLGYLADVRDQIRAFEAAGIRVVLDMHQDLWSGTYGGDGAPDWATQDWSFLPNTPLPFPQNYAHPEVIWNFDRFWKSDRLKRAFRDAWVVALRELAPSPAVIGQDPFNEPFPGIALPRGFDRGRLATFYRDLIPALRAEDPDGLVFVEGNIFTSFGIPSGLPDLGEPNVVYAPHWYDPVHDIKAMLRLDPYDAWSRARAFAGIGAHRRHAARIGAPMWLGEYGTGFGDPRGVQLIADHQDAMNAHLIGGAIWNWNASGPHGFSPVEGGNIPKPGFEAFARPYPIATAGRLTGVTFDAATATLEVAFDDDPGVTPGAGTEIALAGEWWYPAGFTVESSDPTGTWAWQMDAATGRLVVTADPGSSSHVIRVRPR